MNLLLAIMAGTLLVLTIVSGWIKERMWGSETLACLLVGLAIGPLGFGVLSLDPARSVHDREIWTHATRFTLALSVMSAALSIPGGFLTLNRWPLFVLLGPGMLGMWVLASGSAWLALGLSLPLALLVGAVVTPTDPVLARSIVAGRLAKKRVPERLRVLITAESGINDGLALPLVMVGIVLLDGTSRPVETSLLYLVWEVLGALVLGWLLGKGTGALFRFAHERDFAERESLTATTLALALLALSCVALLGADGILAVFVAGVVLRRAMKQEHQQAHEHFQDAVDRSLTLPIFVVLGASVPISGWLEGGWPLVIAALCIALFRRVPIWLALQLLARPYAGKSHALFAGWFGPVGVAALFYACVALEHHATPIVWHLVSLTVCISVVLAGLTGTPLTRQFPETGDDADGSDGDDR
ncbi:sodium:proton antiporter [Qipengyuania sp. JC766]|uniref:cation:proton antiporter n=1 Tax=Qipengyuania sp. JC766 TaxID=3232139 RepID=UPI0034595D5D